MVATSLLVMVVTLLQVAVAIHRVVALTTATPSLTKGFAVPNSMLGTATSNKFLFSK